MRKDYILQQLKQRFEVVIQATDKEFRVNCPFCLAKTGKEDVKQHMYVNPFITGNHGEMGAFNCFRCGSKGWGIDKNLSVTVEEHFLPIKSSSLFDDSVDEDPTNIFSEIVHNKIKTNGKKSIVQAPVTVELPKEFSTSFSDNLIGVSALSYLRKRGLSDAVISSANIGYCNSGKYRACVVLPVYENKNLVYFVARSIYTKVYKNPAVSKKSIVYNIDKIKTNRYSVVCEGIFDALAFGSYGVALLGKSMTDAQLLKITANRPKTIFICLDSDAVNNAATIAYRLRTFIDDVRLVKLPNGKKDPSSCSPSDLAEAVRSAVQADKLGVTQFLLCP